MVGVVVRLVRLRVRPGDEYSMEQDHSRETMEPRQCSCESRGRVRNVYCGRARERSVGFGHCAVQVWQ